MNFAKFPRKPSYRTPPVAASEPGAPKKNLEYQEHKVNNQHVVSIMQIFTSIIYFRIILKLQFYVLRLHLLLQLIF